MFSGGMYVGKHSAQAASVRPKGACDAAACIPLEKMLAFLRRVSKHFDTLPPRGCA
ncbi:hypothetical protein I4200191B4_07810 [Pseudoflavonifractor gallinarum]